MINLLITLAAVYVIYVGWRLTGESIIAWRRSYFPLESDVVGIAYDELDKDAQVEFKKLMDEFEGFGFVSTGYIQLKYYTEQAGALVYLLQARHTGKPILAAGVWLRMASGLTMLDKSFTTLFDDQSELLTERSYIASLLEDEPGQDRLVFVEDIPVSDMFRIHELRLMETPNKSPIPTSSLPQDPIDMYRFIEKWVWQRGLACGKYRPHPSRPGYAFTLKSIIRLKWRPLNPIRNLKLMKLKRRTNRWRKRLNDSTTA